MAMVRPSEKYIEEKQTELETKSKYTTNNAGITQLQTRSSNEELNSLCVSK